MTVKKLIGITTKALKNLEVGEYIHADGSTFIRVPNGWVYEVSENGDMSNSVSCCFIPETIK